MVSDPEARILTLGQKFGCVPSDGKEYLPGPLVRKIERQGLESVGKNTVAC